MSIDSRSKLERYSLGIVVKNKTRGSNEINVTPIEELPHADGDLSKTSNSYDVELPDSKGVQRRSKIEGDVTMSAIWIPSGADNRTTPPDVCAGETVQLYRYADEQQLFWVTLKEEMDLRDRETVRYVFSNKASGVAITDDNCYYIEISTHDKKITLHTSNNDGEACKYDLVINTREGNASLKDSLGNRITMDSKSGKIIAEATSAFIAKAPDIYLDGNVHMSKDCHIVGTMYCPKSETIATGALGANTASSAGVIGAGTGAGSPPEVSVNVPDVA